MIKRSSYVYEIYRRAQFKGRLDECQIAVVRSDTLGHDYYWVYAPAAPDGALIIYT